MTKDLPECGLLLLSLARLPVPPLPREATILSIAAPSGFHEKTGRRRETESCPSCARLALDDTSGFWKAVEA